MALLIFLSYDGCEEGDKQCKRLDLLYQQPNLLLILSFKEARRSSSISNGYSSLYQQGPLLFFLPGERQPLRLKKVEKVVPLFTVHGDAWSGRDACLSMPTDIASVWYMVWLVINCMPFMFGLEEGKISPCD